MILISSCSSRREVIITPSEEDLSKQQKLLSSIYIGQRQSEVLDKIYFSKFNSFEVNQPEINVLYQEYTNFETNITFGFFFKNKKLAAILSEDDSRTLFACRTPFKTHGEHWLAYGVQPYSNWILARNAFDEDFEYRAHKTRTEIQRSDADVAAENTTTLIAYSPLLIIGAPFIAHAAITGKLADEEKRRDENKKKIEFSKTVQIGSSEDEIKDKLGIANRHDTINNNMVLTYFTPSFSYAIDDDGKVVWKEHYSMLELYHRLEKYGDRFYGEQNCGELESFWESKRKTISQKE